METERMALSQREPIGSQSEDITSHPLSKWVSLAESDKDMESPGTVMRLDYFRLRRDPGTSV